MKKYMNVLCVLILALMLIDLVVDFFFDTTTAGPKVNFDSYALGGLLTLLVIALVAFGAICVAFACFIKFILNVNRNEVFTEKNISLIRKYGFSALLCGVCMIVLCICGDTGIVKAVTMSFDTLGEGLFALLMGEVFGIGLRLQEGKNQTA
ncbi:MAG: DUF2975 domain-containing protein [Prevotella sp.]|nr:DUF2975 domain-containing protein [Prevotella sp.]